MNVQLNKIYFYTATIVRWNRLLALDIYKQIIVDSLEYLVLKKKIKLYAFVIMPNHIHLIWEHLELNGKEMPHASFMKFTSHKIQSYLRNVDAKMLEKYKSNLSNRDYQFWQVNSLSIDLFSPDVIFQKLEYLHNNPCQDHWQLSDTPVAYPWSSASFYENGDANFEFLTHIQERM